MMSVQPFQQNFHQRYQLLQDSNHKLDENDGIFFQEAISQDSLPENVTHRDLSMIIKSRIDNNEFDERTLSVFNKYNFQLRLKSAQTGDEESIWELGNLFLVRANKLYGQKNNRAVELRRNFISTALSLFKMTNPVHLNKLKEYSYFLQIKKAIIEFENKKNHAQAIEQVQKVENNAVNSAVESGELLDDINEITSSVKTINIAQVNEGFQESISVDESEESNTTTTTTTSSESITFSLDLNHEKPIKEIHENIAKYNMTSKPTLTEVCRLLRFLLSASCLDNVDKEHLIARFSNDIRKTPEGEQLLREFYFPDMTLNQNRELPLCLPDASITIHITFKRAAVWGGIAENTDLTDERRYRAAEEAMFTFEEMSRIYTNPHAMMKMAIINLRMPQGEFQYHKAGLDWAIRAASHHAFGSLQLYAGSNLDLNEKPLFTILNKYFKAKFKSKLMY